MRHTAAVLAALTISASASLRAQCLVAEDTLTHSIVFGGDQFPRTIALSGDYAYCSACPTAGTSGSNGRVFVFHRAGFDWTQVDIMTAPIQDPNASFGTAIARGGDWLAIGQPFKDGLGFDEGRVEIYSGTDGAWTHHSSLSSSTISQGDGLGQSVAIDGDRLIVGAPFDDPRGAVFVYEWDGSAWIETIRLAPSDPGTTKGFGLACAIQGNWIAVGSPSVGAVYVYQRVNGVWGQQAKVIPSDAIGNTGFGDALAMQDNTLLVGAPSYKPANAAVATGKAYVLVRQSGFWFEQAHINPPQGQGGYLGSSVTLKGDYALVAASQRNYAHLVHRNGTLWNVEATFGQVSSNAPNRGSAVAIQGDTLMLGLLESAGVKTAKTYRFDSGTETYCSAKTNSQGCVPHIDISGPASVSSAFACMIVANSVLEQRAGMLFYSTKSAALIPFHGGTLCLAPPLKRTAVQVAVGAGACNGNYSFDFNAHVASGADPALVAGARFWAQYWSRDPGFSTPDNVGLTDAVTAFVCP